jgi:lipopolysaccharide/colanic/teichoic acid biosynthesis glycosyltransferase
MTLAKRTTDVALCIVLAVPLLPVMIATGILIVLLDGRPVLYVSNRAKSKQETFRLLKFRTMRPDNNDSGASGGHKSHRITRTGAFLRRTRLDEVPQLWNILLGDMSFVGPRPPLMVYVERFPEIYEKVLESRPGVTGLASIYFHEHEEFLLRNCTTPEENERTYEIRCIPRKAHLDLIYARNRSFCFDAWLMLATLFRKLR